MRTSTVRFQNLDALDRTQAGKAKGERSVTYGRIGMDTHAALEDIFCQLEGGERAFLASSGLGAITLALLSVLNARSAEHTSELQSLMRISYAVFCLKKKTKK